MVAEHSSRAKRRKGHIGSAFPDKKSTSTGRPAAGLLAPPPPRLASSPASKTSSATDSRPNSLIAELERIQGRLGIARSVCATAQGALEGASVPREIDIGRALGFGANDVLAHEYSRLVALIHCLKEGRPPAEWIGRWLP